MKELPDGTQTKEVEIAGFRSYLDKVAEVNPWAGNLETPLWRLPWIGLFL